jgi:hypothetical protein
MADAVTVPERIEVASRKISFQCAVEGGKDSGKKHTDRRACGSNDGGAASWLNLHHSGRRSDAFDRLYPKRGFTWL